MNDITLQQLLEAGCHFGHKAERWHPKAGGYIYTKKDGIHIIDLAKTKAGLDLAIAFIKELDKEVVCSKTAYSPCSPGRIS
jgi:small subunit ribosomal protein S2